MYAVLMKQMLYLKMLAWLEDNIYCNPAIDDLAQYMGYSRRFVYDVFYQYGQLPIGQYIRLRRLTIAAIAVQGETRQTAKSEWPGVGTPASIRLRCGHIQRIASCPRLAA